MLFHVMSTRSAAAAANVIDLEAFRQRKQMREERASTSAGDGVAAAGVREAAVLVQVWFCWVPVWTPQMM